MWNYMPPVYFIIFMIIFLIDIDVSGDFFHSNIYNIFPRMDKACVTNEDTK